MTRSSLGGSAALDWHPLSVTCGHYWHNERSVVDMFPSYAVELGSDSQTNYFCVDSSCCVGLSEGLVSLSLSLAVSHYVSLIIGSPAAFEFSSQMLCTNGRCFGVLHHKLTQVAHCWWLDPQSVYNRMQAPRYGRTACNLQWWSSLQCGIAWVQYNAAGPASHCAGPYQSLLILHNYCVLK